jgi:hypothetical protein
MAQPKLDKDSLSLTPPGDTLGVPGDGGHRRDHQPEPNIDVPPKPGQPLPNPENPDLPGTPPSDPDDPGQGQPIPPEMDTTEPRL